MTFFTTPDYEEHDGLLHLPLSLEDYNILLFALGKKGDEDPTWRKQIWRELRKWIIYQDKENRRKENRWMKEIISITVLTEEDFAKVKDKKNVEQEFGEMNKYQEIYDMLLAGEKIQSLEFTSQKFAHRFYIALRDKIARGVFPKSDVLIRKNYVIVNKEK